MNAALRSELSDEAKRALNRYRGRLGDIEFLDLLLRMLASNAISAPPDWLKAVQTEDPPPK